MKSSQKERLVRALSIIAGGYFLISAIGKAFDMGGFAAILAKFQFPGLNFFAPLIIFFELGIALALLLNLRTRNAAKFAMVALTIFSLAFLNANSFQTLDSCGCLGVLSLNGGSEKPIGVIVRNLVLFVFSYFIYKNSNSLEKSVEYWKKYLIILSFVLFAYIMGFTFNNKLEFDTFLKDKKNTFDLRGEAFAKTPLANYNIDLGDNESSMIFCFDYSCPFFWNSVANLQEYRKCSPFDTIILIGTDSNNEKNTFENAFNTTFDHINVEPDEFINSIGISPCTYLIMNDTVKIQIPGTLPAYQNIQKLIKPKEYEKN
jgi:uncharacterized membrane protein YphA (DoxX/SURF4 family)